MSSALLSVFYLSLIPCAACRTVSFARSDWPCMSPLPAGPLCSERCSVGILVSTQSS